MFNRKKQTTQVSSKSDGTQGQGTNFIGQPLKKKNLASKRIVIGLIVLAVLIGGIAWLVKSNQSQTYSVSGSQAGRRLTFSTPYKLTDLYSDTQSPHLQFFTHNVKSSGASSKQINEYRILVSSTDYPKNFPNQKFLDEIQKTILGSTESKTYQTDLKLLRDFAQIAYKGTGVSIDLEKGEVFTNPSINKNAYAIKITGHDIQQKLPDQEGVLIWASGKSAYYHYMLISSKTDWQKNQSAYQKILQSIKIDQ